MFQAPVRSAEDVMKKTAFAETEKAAEAFRKHVPTRRQGHCCPAIN